MKTNKCYSAPGVPNLKVQTMSDISITRKSQKSSTGTTSHENMEDVLMAISFIFGSMSPEVRKGHLDLFERFIFYVGVGTCLFLKWQYLSLV